jgi:Na+-translocating ferredoxin:NAD+ oxidoreductase RnfD subunit
MSTTTPERLNGRAAPPADCLFGVDRRTLALVVSTGLLAAGRYADNRLETFVFSPGAVEAYVFTAAAVVASLLLEWFWLGPRKWVVPMLLTSLVGLARVGDGVLALYAPDWLSEQDGIFWQHRSYLITAVAVAARLIVSWVVYKRDKRFLAPILISSILLFGELTYRFLESYWATGLAVVICIALEMVLGRLMYGKWPILASAYITGLSVGILVRSQYLLIYVLCGLLAISSKYALRLKDRHLWNPSNLGVSILLFVWPRDISPLSQQWGNAIWVPLIIIALGSLILYSLKRLHITAVYVVAFTLLSLLRSPLTGRDWRTEIAQITSPAYLLFMFFMITDPKTTTRTWWRQCVVAVVVAVVETLLRFVDWHKVDTHAPYYALFVVAPVTNFLEIWWDSRTARKAVPAVAAQGAAAGAMPEPATR